MHTHRHGSPLLLPVLFLSIDLLVLHLVRHFSCMCYSSSLFFRTSDDPSLFPFSEPLLKQSFSLSLDRSLFESLQTLFWATFGLIDLENFELTGEFIDVCRVFMSSMAGLESGKGSSRRFCSRAMSLPGLNCSSPVDNPFHTFSPTT